MIDPISNYCAPIVLAGAMNNIWGMPESFARIIIPAGITLLVFIAGQIVVWYRGQKTIQNETKNYRAILLSAIDFIKTSVEKNVVSLRDFSGRVANTEEIHPERLELLEMLAGKIDSIGVDRFVRTFMLNSTTPKVDSLNNKMTYNLIAQFGFLTSIESYVKKNYDSYQSRIIKLMDEWNVVYFKLVEITADWGIKTANPTHPLRPFHNQVHNICQSWQQTASNGKSTMTFSMTNLVEPLSQLSKGVLAQNANNEYAYELHKILEKIKFIDLQWRTSKEGDDNFYSDVAASIEESYKSLVNTKEYFEQKTAVKGIFALNKS